MEENISHMASLGNANNSPGSEKQNSGYMKHYMQDYRKRKQRLEIYVTPNELKRIKESASNHHQKLTEHGRKCILAYIDETILVTSEAELQNLRFEINRIGNNINQIAYRVNKLGAGAFDETYFQKNMRELETVINQKASQTITKDILIDAIRNSRLTLKQIESLLQL